MQQSTGRDSIYFMDSNGTSLNFFKFQWIKNLETKMYDALLMEPI